MTFKRKLTIAGVTAALVAYVTPLAWASHTNQRYYYRGRCACGNPIFVHIKDDGYYEYSPGHGVPEYRRYAIRQNNGDLDLIALHPPEGSISPIPEGAVAGRVHLDHGALYESWTGRTNSARYARIYNLWQIWIPQALSH